METLSFEIEPGELEIFLQDVNENLQALEAGILNLEQAADPESLNAAFRAAHTLKAVGAAIHHQRMAELTHALETLFDALRERRISSSQALADELLTTVDILRALRDEVITREPSGIDTAPWVARLRAIPTADATPAPHAAAAELRVGLAPPALAPEQVAQGQQALAAGLKLWEVGIWVERGDFTAARLFQAQLALQEVGIILAQTPSEDELLSDQHEGALWLLLATQTPADGLESRLADISDLTRFSLQPFALEAAESPRKSSRPAGSEPDKTVRISVERLDTLMDLVGELATDRIRLLQVEKLLRDQYGKGENVSALDASLAHLGQVIDQLQDEVMHARMLPIGQLFEKFPRQVRDLARESGKQVDLIMEGETTELDRSLIEAIGDPLVHLLRNALDHGLESPQERRIAGKPPTGTLRLAAAQAEGQIVITVQDDGRGLDPQRIRQTALDRGILNPEEAGRLSDDEAIALIFRPGFSTAERITEISGRGVGLDVVQTNINRIGGAVTIENAPGRGVTFRVSLPLTLAIIPAMLVALGDEVYAVPLTHVIESLDLTRTRVHTVKGAPAIHWRNEVLPLLSLRRFFSNPHTPPDPAAPAASVIAVSWGRMQAGLIVDKILDKQEIVVKPLGPVIGNVPGISGCTILGNGRIALIADVPALINVTLQSHKGEPRDGLQ